MAKPKQASIKVQKEVQDIIADRKESLALECGKVVKIGFIRPDTQDKIGDIFTRYELKKKGAKDEEISVSEFEVLNKETRQYFSKIAAAVLLNTFFKLRLFWWIKWRMIYYFSGFTGNDYASIFITFKKKATEQGYLAAMALSTTMVDTWTTMTKKEAEEYQAVLKSANEGH